jgi:hypothetical protein
LEIPGQIIFSFPSQAMRQVSDIQAIGQIFSDIMKNVNSFAGLERRFRTERFVFDVQIALGM